MCFNHLEYCEFYGESEQFVVVNCCSLTVEKKMIKHYTRCLVLFIGNLIVGQSVDIIKFVKYDIYVNFFEWNQSSIDR